MNSKTPIFTAAIVASLGGLMIFSDFQVHPAGPVPQSVEKTDNSSCWFKHPAITFNTPRYTWLTCWSDDFCMDCRQFDKEKPWTVTGAPTYGFNSKFTVKQYWERLWK